MSEPSASPWRAIFIFPILVVTHCLFIFQGRETNKNERKKKRSCSPHPPCLPGSICLSSIPRKSRRPHPLLCSLGTPAFCLQLKWPLILASPGILQGQWPVFSQPDSKLACHQQVSPLTRYGHRSASRLAPACSLASSLESHLVDQLASKPMGWSPPK